MNPFGNGHPDARRCFEAQYGAREREAERSVGIGSRRSAREHLRALKRNWDAMPPSQMFRLSEQAFVRGDLRTSINAMIAWEQKWEFIRSAVETPGSGGEQ